MPYTIRILMLILSVFILVPALSMASDVSTVVRQSEIGAIQPIVQLENAGAVQPVIQLGDGFSATTFSPAAPMMGGSREATILWHRHHEDAIYTSTGLSGPEEMAFAGTYLNAPMHAEATPLTGDGTAAWMYGGNKFYVDASRDGQVLAAIDYYDSESRAVISEWRPGSYVPLWTYEVSPCRSLVYGGWASRKPIQVSDDGSTIAVAMVRTPGGSDLGHLYMFEAGNGTPVVDWDFPSGNVVAMDMTTDGAYVAMAGWPNIHVYDRDGDTVRWSGPIGSGNDALAISADGQYLCWGWTSVNLRQWNGSSYGSFWSHNPGSGNYLGQCAFSPDGSLVALTFDNGSTSPQDIWLEMREMPSLDLLWDYDYVSTPRGTALTAGDADGGGQRDPTDITTQMFFSPDSEHLAIASWGDTYPEVHVFEQSSSVPIFTLDTPGSMYDVNVAAGPGGVTYVVACGKGVHAGISGRGGDLYSVGISSATVEAELACLPASGTVPFATSMTVTLTNLYTGQTRRIAGRINVEVAGGAKYSNWKSGWTNTGAGASFVTSWNQTIPALGSVIGDSVFNLVAEDVTPPPYNQPPHPPAGDTAASTCTVTGVAP